MRVTELLRFEPRLVEEAVWRAIRGRTEEREFDGAREAVYEIVDPDERERAFALFYGSWFRRLTLGDPVLHAIDERLDGLASVRRVAIVRAAAWKQEGAELFVADRADRSVVVAILPDTLVDHHRTRTLLRRELLHVADMLDPAFEYAPRLPAQRTGPAADRPLQDRYRVLWNCSVDGRLLREGRLGEGAREARLEEFRSVFRCLGDHVEEGFARLFDGPRPSHPRLTALAANPELAFGLQREPRSAGARCSLCGFPTSVFESAPEKLPERVLGTIRSEFPEWTTEHGLCRQCADLYRARSLSATAEELVPSAISPPATR